MQNPLSTYTATQIHARASSARAAARGGGNRRRHGHRRRRYYFGTGSLTSSVGQGRSCECLSLVLLLGVTAILFGFFLSRSLDTWRLKEEREQPWIKAEDCVVVRNATTEKCDIFASSQVLHRVNLTVKVTVKGSDGNITNEVRVLTECIPLEEAQEEAKGFTKPNEVDSCYVAPFNEKLVRLSEGFDPRIASQAKRTAITMIILTATAGISLVLIVLGALFHNLSNSGRAARDDDGYRGGRDPTESSGNRRNVLTETEAGQLLRKCRLGPEALEKLPPERNVCSVCLEELSTSAESNVSKPEREERDCIVELPCSHAFHGTKCILCWLRRGNGTCPTCNFDVVSFVRNNPSFGEEESDDVETTRSTERGSNDSAHPADRTEGRPSGSARNVIRRLLRLRRGERGSGRSSQPLAEPAEAEIDEEQGNPSLQPSDRSGEQEGRENEEQDSEPLEIVTSSPGSNGGHSPGDNPGNGSPGQDSEPLEIVASSPGGNGGHSQGENPRNGSPGHANTGSGTEVETRFPD